jgi:hypothetical protein
MGARGAIGGLAAQKMARAPVHSAGPTRSPRDFISWGTTALSCGLRYGLALTHRAMVIALSHSPSEINSGSIASSMADPDLPSDSLEFT